MRGSLNVAWFNCSAFGRLAETWAQDALLNREVVFALIKNENQDEVGAVPIMVVHNEIVFQVPADQAQEWLVKAKADGMKECL
ncbi:MAG: hypothetical protein O7E55_03195 [Chloroflexi bacterium]|nr:hypothetical protein [Chloroflexota bacterium]